MTKMKAAMIGFLPQGADPFLADIEQYARILRGHGLSRVLFATDCPWSTPERELKLLDQVEMTAQERHDVLCGNALRLLGKEI